MSRCFDCFYEFGPEEARVMVLKQMRDWPHYVDPVESRLLHSLLFDQVPVCVDCAGWYGDDGVSVSAEAAP